MASTKLSSKHNWWIVKLNKGELLYRNKNNAVYAGSDVVNGVVRKDGYLLVIDHDEVYINQRDRNTDVIDVHTKSKDKRSKNAVFYFDEVPDAEKWQNYIHKHLNAISEANPKLSSKDLEYPSISDIKVAVGQKEPTEKIEYNPFDGCPKPLKYAVIGIAALIGVALG